MRRVTAALALAGAAVVLAAPAGGAMRRARRSWGARVAVTGSSMEPTLRAGDWLLVDPPMAHGRLPARGELVVAPDPRARERLLVKRVAGVDADGRLVLAGDRPDASTDSRTFGPVDPGSVLGRPWFRYLPLRRAGRVR